MSSKDWWLSEMDLMLSQGDILEGVPLFMPVAPLARLKKAPTKGGGKEAWEIVDVAHIEDRHSHVLARGVEPLPLGLVLNHSCDLDKSLKRPVLIAPVQRLSQVPEAQHADIRAGRAKAMFFMPDVPSVGDCVAEIRKPYLVPGPVVRDLKRLASMAETAQSLLHAHLVTFYTRRNLPEAPAVA